MKILPAEAELFHAGGRTSGRTDRHDEANSRFLQFCEQDYNLFPLLCSSRFLAYSQNHT